MSGGSAHAPGLHVACVLGILGHELEDGRPLYAFFYRSTFQRDENNKCPLKTERVELEEMEGRCGYPRLVLQVRVRVAQLILSQHLGSCDSLDEIR